MDIDDRVSQLLVSRFPGAVVEVGRFHGAERVHGHILWDGFDDVEQFERQRQIYEALQEGLGADAMQVSIILAYTPFEYELMSAA